MAAAPAFVDLGRTAKGEESITQQTFTDVVATPAGGAHCMM